jgi:hypothetical protein
MMQMATIRFDGGALLLPARDPYEREVVFEQADFYARRHGSVGVRLGRSEFRVARSLTAGVGACFRCHQPLRTVRVEMDGRRICTNCAKQTAR